MSNKAKRYSFAKVVSVMLIAFGLFVAVMAFIYDRVDVMIEASIYCIFGIVINKNKNRYDKDNDEICS